MNGRRNNAGRFFGLPGLLSKDERDKSRTSFLLNKLELYAAGRRRIGSPHVQTVIEGKPSHFTATITQKANSYREATGSNLWRDLIAYEKDLDERFIASTGNIDWFTSFAPRGWQVKSGLFSMAGNPSSN